MSAIDATDPRRLLDLAFKGDKAKVIPRTGIAVNQP